MTCEEYRQSQKRRLHMMARNYGIVWLALAVLLAIQWFFRIVDSASALFALGSRKEGSMTLESYRNSQHRRVFSVATKSTIAGLVLVVLFAISAGMVKPVEAGQAKAQMPRMEHQLQTPLQDMLVMRQNTATWTPQGLVVLQGNRLLHYSAGLRLLHTLDLPVARPEIAAPAAQPGPGNVEADAAPDTGLLCRSQVTARILATDDGLIVIRGQQVLKLDGAFNIKHEAVLPDLDPLTAAELAAVCPMADQMQLAGEMDPGVSGIPMAGTVVAPKPHPLLDW